MAKKLLSVLALLTLTAACGNRQPQPVSPQPEVVASFPLGSATELRLLSNGNLSQLELYFGGYLQELVGTANTDYLRNNEGHIVLDTLTDTALAPAYVVRTFDRSSTYGAEVWYLLYPYRHDDPDGPWNLVKLSTDRPSAEDIAPYLK
jgi:hypothetical protein